MFYTFMEVLDTTVVNVSLPHIVESLSPQKASRFGRILPHIAQPGRTAHRAQKASVQQVMEALSRRFHHVEILQMARNQNQPLHDGKVLISDESLPSRESRFSSLIPLTDNTLIFIGGRLTLRKIANRIIVIDQIRIIETEGHLTREQSRAKGASLTVLRPILQ